MTTPSDPDSTPRLSRRALLAGTAAAVGGAVLETLPLGASPTPQPPPTPPTAPPAGAPNAASTAAPPAPAVMTAADVPPDASTVLGTPTTAQSARSPFVTPARTPIGVVDRARRTRRCRS